MFNGGRYLRVTERLQFLDVRGGGCGGAGRERGGGGLLVVQVREGGAALLGRKPLTHWPRTVVHVILLPPQQNSYINNTADHLLYQAFAKSTITINTQ